MCLHLYNNGALNKEARFNFLDVSCIGSSPTEPLSPSGLYTRGMLMHGACTANTVSAESSCANKRRAQPKIWSPDYVIHDELYRMLLSALPNAASGARV